MKAVAAKQFSPTQWWLKYEGEQGKDSDRVCHDHQYNEQVSTYLFNSVLRKIKEALMPKYEGDIDYGEGNFESVHVPTVWWME